MSLWLVSGKTTIVRLDEWARVAVAGPPLIDKLWIGWLGFVIAYPVCRLRLSSLGEWEVQITDDPQEI
jgi:hypothetical protein